MTSLYADALQLARKELASKKADLYKMEQEVRRLEHTVLALTALVGKPKEIDAAAGITECVKQALQLQAPAGLYPTTLKLKLEEAGFPFDDHKNPMATIHSILKRLEKSRFIKRGTVEGKTAYFWLTGTPQKHVPMMEENGDDIPF